MGYIHSQRLERWLGAEKISQLQISMKGWYGRPICLRDVPGSVWITADGDFVGNMPSGLGYFMGAIDTVKDYWDRIGHVQHGYANGGFASIIDALSQARQGFSNRRIVNKIGTASVVGRSYSLWLVGPQPPAGSSGAAAPGGTTHVSTDTGAVSFTNPASGSFYLVGADFAANVISSTLLIYDRLFSVAKTINSTATETVSGVPTRYQSITSTDSDYIGDNFGFIETATNLTAGAHNWTVCTYDDQDGASSTLPSVAGVSNIAANGFDQPFQQWFLPLASGDIGIKAWTQMQCDALITAGSLNFCIGHPLGFMVFPMINMLYQFEWLTNRDQAPQIFNDACIAFIEVIKPASSVTTYTGHFQMTSA